jgi:hypothetical protein
MHGIKLKDVPDFDISDAGYVLTVNGAGDNLEFQAPTTVAVNEGWYTLTPSAGAVTPDLDNGIVQVVDLTANLTVHAPIRTSTAIVAGDRLKLRFKQDGTGGWVATLNSTYKIGTYIVDTTASLVSVFDMVYNGTSWEIHTGTSGLAI